VRAAYDNTTVAASNAAESQFITDGTLFAAFAPELRLDVMDVTDYEGANLIWNMCEPVPHHLHETYDVIFNGSVLDNIFDPAQAMRNMTRLLAPRGRIIHIEMVSNFLYEYLIYSTDWFIDYQIVSGFTDCCIYVGTQFKPRAVLGTMGSVGLHAAARRASVEPARTGLTTRGGRCHRREGRLERL
jgi:hypothetical protein